MSTKLDFVKFYIVQLVKNAASRIRLIDKEKEKLLSKLVARIENSQELFPDLKMMERVVELEETATKLISIYRRLNKSHIDLEKISYQFTSDRDAIQSTLRRFLQGNFRNGIVHKKRPKIVFDDTTLTIYELKEPEPEPEDQTIPSPDKPRVDLFEFLKTKDEEIISVKEKEVLDETETEEKDNITVRTPVDEQIEENEKINQIEIDDKLATQKLPKSDKSEEKEKFEEELMLPLEFDWDLKNDKSSEDQVSSDEVSKNLSSENLSEVDNLSFNQNKEETKSIVEESKEVEEEFVQNKNVVQEENKETVESSSSEDFENLEIPSETDLTKISEVVFQSVKASNDNLYLDFEKMVLDNILEVDDYLHKVQKETIDDETQLRIIQRAYRSYELAKELQFELVSELIKVYWLALVAIRDNRLQPTKLNAELIRSTLIILVTLIKQHEIDLEKFMQKHNQLKELLKSLEYEV